MKAPEAPLFQGYEVAVHSNLLARRYTLDELPNFEDTEMVLLQEECQNNISYLRELVDNEKRVLEPAERGRIRRNRMMIRAIQHELHMRREAKNHEIRRQNEQEKTARARLALEAKTSKADEKDLAFIKYYKSLGLPTAISKFNVIMKKYKRMRDQHQALREIIFERYGHSESKKMREEALAKVKAKQNGGANM